MAGGISIHGVDVARGVAAEGLYVELHALAPERRLLAAGRLGANGQLDHPTVRGAGIALGPHEALFHIGDWLRDAGYPEDQTRFLDILPFRFVVTDLDRHLHLPLKFTPYGVSLFLGV
ncbi:hydroxyisourate hydrolase [Azospirillum doebereinerae]|uniref:Hydroxyisourate hydrolase n=1 Tax=Azospirillum doebereinerae TaxID=92933 RepID=A0A433JCT8_9PROT|nr:hydroxyisourate hydrolase [Azospirillum doebereinerae]MCG5238407.1 hydroxyisourate hydrolase [Azospirillum doebereinerae]RUQ74499.1 hydroxyisourate hydrolase [Azospirillum doebereinerae]